jgi:hypothetical protein
VSLNPQTHNALAGTTRWACVKQDAIRFLDTLPDDSVDLLVTSPPYEAARTYGIGFRLTGEQWVEWMVRVVKAAAPKVKGLIAINCEGQTRGFSYSGVPFLLFADLKRAGFTMRKPVAFKRNGILGSGGPDWLRNDWEPVLCITRPGRLPFSNNTACGKPPKYRAGGAPSHRDRNGTRTTDRRPSGELTKRLYVPPEIANPGNVVDCGTVGGGHMGHPLAHQNEAPFPVDLPAFFVKSFCPIGGVVLDPFAGSGTTGEAAISHGCRFVGCDIRQSQVDLTRNRLETVTPSLFGGPLAKGA